MMATSKDASSRLHARAYQLEMFEKSMKENTIVIMGTGTGKTHVSCLRIEAELQKSTQKRVWFMAPVNDLVSQQYAVLVSQLPQYRLRKLTGDDNVNRWSKQKIWDTVLSGVNVVVSTPQVLLDAMRNAFVSLRDVSLLVFDEAHHCQKKAPYACIMNEFYYPLKAESPKSTPHVLGLTATSQVGGKKSSSVDLEKNLDAICRTPTRAAEEYACYVYRPEFVGLSYLFETQTESKIFSLVGQVVEGANMYNDPYYQDLQTRADSGGLAAVAKLQQIQKKGRTPATKELKDLLGNATALYESIGSWASDYFVQSCILGWYNNEQNATNSLGHSPDLKRRFITSQLTPLKVAVTKLMSVQAGVRSSKANTLIRYLQSSYQHGISIIIFVERRSAAYALCELLKRSPELNNYRIFSYMGRAGVRQSSLTEIIDAQSQSNSFAEFREGTQDICVATAVAEEGLDIQAVNFVIRYDDPKQLRSFIQSMGRARRKESKFVYFYEALNEQPKYELWKLLQLEMEAEYQREMRQLEDYMERGNIVEEGQEIYIVSSTGARLVYDNAMTHLQHFCQTSSLRTDPIYILKDEGEEKVSAKVFLPSCVPTDLQEFYGHTMWLNQKTAKKDAAFQAFKALHQAGIVNDNLMPILPEKHKEPQLKHGFREYEIKDELQVWPSELPASKLYSYQVETQDSGAALLSMKISLPLFVDHTLEFPLCDSDSSTVNVRVIPLRQYTGKNSQEAKNVTRQLFVMTFGNGSAASSLAEASRIPLILTPDNVGVLDLPSQPTKLVDFLQASSGLLGTYPLFLYVEDRLRPFLWRPPHELHMAEGGKVTINVTTVRRLQIFTNERTNAVTSTKQLKIEECVLKPVGTFYGPFIRLIPSIMHLMAAAARTESARLAPLASIGFRTAKHLVPALLAKSASGTFNYERMEFLGDAYLKFRASLQMFFENPHGMEGVLTFMVQEIVSNKRLETGVLIAGLETYITTQSPSQAHWKIPEFTNPHNQVGSRKIQSKTLADVVESVLAAAILETSTTSPITKVLITSEADEKCTRALKLFIPDVNWIHTEDITKGIIADITESVETSPLASIINTMFGYEFRRPALLQESFTHATSLPGQQSYDRLEFLGDAILDVLLKKRLFEFQKLNPDRMTSCRHALASHLYLAYCALGLSFQESTNQVHFVSRENSLRLEETKEQRYFTDLIRFDDSTSRHAILQSRRIYDGTEDKIEEALRAGVFPWTLLRSLNAPKATSDVIESLIAAVYLDSGGSLDECDNIVTKTGMWSLLGTMAIDDEFEVMTPASRLRELCAKLQITLDIQRAYQLDNGKFVGRIVLNNVSGAGSVEYDGPEAICEEEARSLVTERLIDKLLSARNRDMVSIAQSSDEAPSFSQDFVMSSVDDLDLASLN